MKMNVSPNINNDQQAATKAELQAFLCLSTQGWINTLYDLRKKGAKWCRVRYYKKNPRGSYQLHLFEKNYCVIFYDLLSNTYYAGKPQELNMKIKFEKQEWQQIN